VAKARKRFGQHFLEPAWVGKLVATIAPQPTDVFIEIGPGRGAITEPLAARAAKVVAVEVDRDLAAALEARGLPNVTVVNADVLEVDLVSLVTTTLGRPARSRIAGNLPYNISSPILFRLLNASASGVFEDAYLMLQKEVADRLVATPGTGDYGVLTLSTMLRADVTRVLSLPPGAFRPAPSVHSAVVRLQFRPPPPEVADADLVVAIVRSVFTQRRKTIANALAPFATSRHASPKDLLREAGIDPQVRPENLHLADYARLSRACAIVSP
jgi:16S rRNA (adenine1518-N6/adenine1519-N6)-dimethyltransferase